MKYFAYRTCLAIHIRRLSKIFKSNVHFLWNVTHIIYFSIFEKSLRTNEVSVIKKIQIVKR